MHQVILVVKVLRHVPFGVSASDITSVVFIKALLRIHFWSCIKGLTRADAEVKL